MGTINIEKLRQSDKDKNKDIIKDEFKDSDEKAFLEFHKSSQEEYQGRAKFNGKLLAIIALIVLAIFFIIYMCTTSISDVVEKNTGTSVVTADAKMFTNTIFLIE